MGAQPFRYRRDNRSGSQFGLFKVVLTEITVTKKAFEPGHTAHRQAEQRGGFCSFAGNQLGAAATNIHHQTAIGAAGGVRHALINQACFIFTADDVDGTTEQLLRVIDKQGGVFGQA